MWIRFKIYDVDDEKLFKHKFYLAIKSLRDLYSYQMFQFSKWNLLERTINHTDMVDVHNKTI